jgi:N-methylhydantoinase B
VAQFSGQGERFLNPPWGLFGGEPGGMGRFLIRGRDGEIRALPTKPGPVEIHPDEALIVETAGGGGYGPPAERDRAALAEDLASGKFSAGFLARGYGYGEEEG